MKISVNVDSDPDFPIVFSGDEFYEGRYCFFMVYLFEQTYLGMPKRRNSVSGCICSILFGSIDGCLRSSIRRKQ